MRQGPSEQYTMIKRNFFARGAATVALDNVVVAMKGVYSSIRLCNVSPLHLLWISLSNQPLAKVLGWRS